MTELYEERAAAVLEALAGWHCKNCGDEMRDPAYCDACCWLFCPYCGTPSFEDCDHLVAVWDPDQWFSPSPFDGLELPHLPERPEGYWPERWPETVLEAAFGELRPLLEAYDDYGYDSELNGYGAYMLWTGVRTMLSEQPGSRNRFVPSHPGHSHYEDAFFEDPDRARAEITEIIARLIVGFEQLVAMHEQGEATSSS